MAIKIVTINYVAQGSIQIELDESVSFESIAQQFKDRAIVNDDMLYENIDEFNIFEIFERIQESSIEEAEVEVEKEVE